MLCRRQYPVWGPPACSRCAHSCKPPTQLRAKPCLPVESVRPCLPAACAVYAATDLQQQLEQMGVEVRRPPVPAARARRVGTCGPCAPCRMMWQMPCGGSWRGCPWHVLGLRNRDLSLTVSVPHSWQPNMQTNNFSQQEAVVVHAHVGLDMCAGKYPGPGQPEERVAAPGQAALRSISCSRSVAAVRMLMWGC